MAKVNITKASKEAKQPYGRVQTRLYRGWELEEALNTERVTSISSMTPAKNSTSGVRGVSWDKNHNKWFAQLQHEKKTIYCGRYDSIEEARVAIINKKRELGGII